MTKKLIINDGERELLLVANLVVGRDPACDITGDDLLLSRRHAEFLVRDAGVVVRDLGSRNGVYVNGQRTAEGALSSGDLVRIGHLRVRYLEDSTPLSSAVAAAAADFTGVVALPNPVPTPAPSSPGDIPGTEPADDEERTRLVRPPTVSPSAPPDEERTRLVRPPAAPPPAPPDEEMTRLVRPPSAAPKAGANGSN